MARSYLLKRSLQSKTYLSEVIIEQRMLDLSGTQSHQVLSSTLLVLWNSPHRMRTFMSHCLGYRECLSHFRSTPYVFFPLVVGWDVYCVRLPRTTFRQGE